MVVEDLTIIVVPPPGKPADTRFIKSGEILNSVKQGKDSLTLVLNLVRCKHVYVVKLSVNSGK